MIVVGSLMYITWHVIMYHERVWTIYWPPKGAIPAEVFVCPKMRWSQCQGNLNAPVDLLVVQIWQTASQGIVMSMRNLCESTTSTSLVAMTAKRDTVHLGRKSVTDTSLLILSARLALDWGKPLLLRLCITGSLWLRAGRMMRVTCRAFVWAVMRGFISGWKLFKTYFEQGSVKKNYW